ncbi:MAG TPA: MarR family transcriptional regulator [Candidatus Angelobacter sp.]|nr:MarR family transcriptional regulator [Candidatus Angelobacter sp.]
MSKLTKTEELADRLHSTAIHLLRQVRVQDAASGLAPARLSALSVLVFGGAMSLNDLARAEQVRPPTMSRIVDALESASLIRRTTNPQDRRAVVLEATEKGKAILLQGRKRRVKFLAKHLSRLSKQERKQIDGAIKAIQKAMTHHL